MGCPLQNIKDCYTAILPSNVDCLQFDITNSCTSPLCSFQNQSCSYDSTDDTTCLQFFDKTFVLLVYHSKMQLNNTELLKTAPQKCDAFSSDWATCSSNSDICTISTSKISHPAPSNSGFQQIFLYLIVPCIALAILIPCMVLRLKSCHGRITSKPIITSSEPMEIAFEERVTPELLKSLSNSENLTPSNDAIRHQPSMELLPMTNTLSVSPNNNTNIFNNNRASYQSSIYQASVNSSGQASTTVRIVSSLQNDTSSPSNKRTSAIVQPLTSSYSSESTAFVYTDTPPNYDH